MSPRILRAQLTAIAASAVLAAACSDASLRLIDGASTGADRADGDGGGITPRADAAAESPDASAGLCAPGAENEQEPNDGVDQSRVTTASAVCGVATQGDVDRIRFASSAGAPLQRVDIESLEATAGLNVSVFIDGQAAGSSLVNGGISSTGVPAGVSEVTIVLSVAEAGTVKYLVRAVR